MSERAHDVTVSRGVHVCNVCGYEGESAPELPCPGMTLRESVEALRDEWAAAAKVTTPGAGVDHVAAAHAAVRLNHLLATHPAPTEDAGRGGGR